MASLNRVEIIGNVGQDPELRYTQSGKAVVNFSVAANKTWTDNTTKEKREKTTWFRITAWGDKWAETLMKYVKKGMLVRVEGEIDGSAYINQAGEAAYSLEITARDVLFLSRSDNENGGNDTPYPAEPEELPF